MGCKCTEISILSRKIYKLKLARSTVNSILSEMEQTKESLGSSANFYETGAIFNGSEKNTADSIRKGYDSSIEETKSAFNVIVDTIGRYETRLESMKSEDSSYHRSKSKHKSK